MPKITRNYEIKESNLELINSHVLSVLKSLNADGIEESKTENGNKITATVPSIWGWGGMNLGIIVSVGTENISQLLLEGYITQLATGPLKKTMDKFIDKLSDKVGRDNITSIKSGNNITINALDTKGKDKKMITFVLIATFIPLFLGLFLGRQMETVLGSLVILVGYFLFGKKILSKD